MWVCALIALVHLQPERVALPIYVSRTVHQMRQLPSFHPPSCRNSALREAERPEMASLESELAALTAMRNELAVRGEALRASGSDTKAATVALIDDIVRDATRL